jgi:hypothetical protein
MLVCQNVCKNPCDEFLYGFKGAPAARQRRASPTQRSRQKMRGAER